MTSPIAGSVATVAANTEFLGMASELFNRRQDTTWSRFTKVVPCDGRALELDAVGPSPVVAKLTGMRTYGSLREYALRTPVAEYAADALELSRVYVEKDKTGAVSRRLADYLSASSNFFEKPVVDYLLSNPLGIDGVSLFNDSHPHAPSAGTWDNKTTSTLSQTSLEAGDVAMRSLRLENGEWAGIRPTALVVSPKWRREAIDLLGSQRMMPVDSSGAPDAASSVVAAVMIENWIGGQLELFVIDRMADGTHDDDWFLLDLSRPDVRPIVVGEAIAPMGVVVDQPSSEPMLQRSSYAYYVQAAAAISGYAPHCIYGRMS